MTKVENDHTPIGRIAVTVIGTVSAISLHAVNIWLSTAAAMVSLIVGILTAILLVRKLRRKDSELNDP